MDKKIAIYSDQGASEVGVASLQKAVQAHLGETSRLLTATDILCGQLADCLALIIPGGADLPYCAKLNGEGNRRIRQFVEQGGLYVGICAGAYYACRAIDFIGADYTVAGQRELAFFDGMAKGSLPQWTNGRYFDESVATKATVELALTTGEKSPFYYHGGPVFLANRDANYQTLACYPDGLPAIVSGKIGQGHYLLSAVHFELQAVSYQHHIVEAAEQAEYAQEQAICQLFDRDYGKPIWRIIQSLLNH